MLQEYIRTKQYLYQFGNAFEDYFVFPKTNFSAPVSKSVKTQYLEANFIDGVIRTNLTDRNKLTGIDLETNFQIQNNSYYTLDYVKKVFFSRPKKIFFYTLDNDENIRFFFNPFADVSKTIEQKEQSQVDDSQLIENVQVGFKLPLPFVYECGANISYFDKDSYQTNVVRFNSGSTFNSGKIFNAGINAGRKLISTLSINTKKLLFANPAKPIYPLFYIDKFFDRSYFAIESPIINTTLTNNNVTDIVTNNSYKNTTAKNSVYLIEIGQMAQGDVVSIRNQSNASSFNITWLDSTSSPALIYYNSVWQRFYDGNGIQIPLSSIKTEKVESGDDFLYFSALANSDKIFAFETEIIRLQKQSSTNISVKIEILNTYQL
jgi:hypothetical protein